MANKKYFQELAEALHEKHPHFDSVDTIFCGTADIVALLEEANANTINALMSIATGHIAGETETMTTYTMRDLAFSEIERLGRDVQDLKDEFLKPLSAKAVGEAD